MTILKEDNIHSQTLKTLKKNHMKDALGVLYSRINGLTGFIILTWLLKNFRKNQFSSTYLLTINIHIPFETFYHFKYVVNEPFMKVPVTQNDDTDLRFR